MAAIYVENLFKQYQNGVQALNGLTLSVGEGEIFSLLGPNGAGKSTLIQILTTFLRPTSGVVQMLGKDGNKDAAAIRPEIACVAQKTSIDTYLSLTENMMFQSRIYKIPKTEAKVRMESLIDCFGLERYRKYPASSYSGGVKRRLDIAINMMSRPKILFLDEPTVGMDIQSRRAMWEMMEKIKHEFGTTIFLTTHYLEEADSLSDAICIMKDGKDIVQGAPSTLRSYLRQDLIKISFLNKDAAKQNQSQITNFFSGKISELRGEAVMVTAEHGQEDLWQAGRFLLEQRIPFVGLELTQPTIEDVFLRLTSGIEGCA